MELDLSLILLAITIKRGQFTSEYVLNMDNNNDKFIKKNTVVNSPAVFVAVVATGNIDPTKAMRVDALNTKLRDACATAGFPKRNTMYSFR